jgi:uncharacterized protein with PIN domain
MEILTSQLPSGGYGYSFGSIRINPLTFLEITRYLEDMPKDDVLGKYLYDIRMLQKDDENIKNCYIMDVDFLIFFKKLCTISQDLSYQISIKCPHCGHEIQKSISFEKDIHFKQIDEKIMNGARIELGGHTYDTIIPTVNEFMKVFNIYLRYRKIEGLKMIKTIALIKDFDSRSNQVEQDVLGATYSDVTLLMALRDLYYDRLEPIELYCPECNKGLKPEERRSVAVSVDSLIVDFFRDLYINSPIDGSKILFK